MAKRSLLITGGAGFIGSSFVEHIMKKYPSYKVKVLDLMSYAGNPENIPGELRRRKNFHFRYGNVCSASLVDEMLAGVDTVVHFAAETHVARSIYDNGDFYQTDVLGTQAVANAVVKNRNVRRFVHVSTSEVYGTAEREPMDEEHPLKPRSPYASAKAGADRLVYSYVATYDIPAVIVRPFNNYGPRQHLEKLVPRFITSALMDRPLTVHGKGRVVLLNREVNMRAGRTPTARNSIAGVAEELTARNALAVDAPVGAFEVIVLGRPSVVMLDDD